MGALFSLFSPAQEPDDGMQTAFVFAKPHANTTAFQAKIKEKFAAVGIQIRAEGEITGETIDKQGYIDQHYYAIASKATIMKPKDLNVPLETFKKNFGEDWATVLAEDRAFNAMDVQKKLGISPEELDAAWGKQKDAKKLIKFGGGFYCACVDEAKKIYTFNAFFMSMRSQFTAAGTSIHYFVVSFDPAKLSWADFRGKVLGPTDPAAAPEDSLRGIVHAEWEALGLPSAPTIGQNGVHASASPFEGLAERTNWLQLPLQADPFARRLLAGGIPTATIKAWSVDPQVVLADGSGKKGSLFDQLEDMDLDECVATCVKLYEAQPKDARI